MAVDTVQIQVVLNAFVRKRGEGHRCLQLGEDWSARKKTPLPSEAREKRETANSLYHVLLANFRPKRGLVQILHQMSNRVIRRVGLECTKSRPSSVNVEACLVQTKTPGYRPEKDGWT